MGIEVSGQTSSCVSGEFPGSLQRIFQGGLHHRYVMYPSAIALGPLLSGLVASERMRYFEVIVSLEGPLHAGGWARKPCQVRRAVGPQAVPG